MNERKSAASVTDVPLIGKEDGEALGMGDYATALVEFVAECATPLTIGIQGEWGSGKTSLMNMIREDLAQRRIATSWVNTWEYSMFRAPAETAPAVVRGMLEGLRENFSGHWPTETREKVEKVGRVLKNLGKFAVNAAAQQTIGRGDLVEQLETETSTAARAEIAELKKELQDIIDQIVKSQDNPYVRVAFFIDDLDRIDPPVAVNVLESIKNIFDLRHCVFLLAIDYDVVVKGLRSKFGEKTPENEREFRSFFDKIIQLPFSMPISVYDVERMIQELFGRMGMVISETMLPIYRDVVIATVGANPRSMKRYVNTYSLLRRLHAMTSEADDDSLSPEDSAGRDLFLFAVIGLQIAYPRIYSLLVRNPDIVAWDEDMARAEAIEVNIPDELSANDLLDEPWEQILWSYCQGDPWLRSRTFTILRLINRLRDVVGSERVGERLAEVLQVTNMTAVDDDEETRHKQRQRVRYDSIESYIDEQKSKGMPKRVLEEQVELHQYIVDVFGAENVKVNFAPTMVSYSPLVNGRRGKVFLYVKPQKRRGVSLYFPHLEGVGDPKVAYEDVDGAPGALRNRLEEGYRACVR